MILSRARRRASERGQSLVETAIVLPLLLLLLAGIVDFGRAFYSYIAITNAAREGARRGIRFSPPTLPAGAAGAMATMARQELSNQGLDVGSVAVAAGASGNSIVVTISYPFQSILGGIIGRPVLNLSTRAEMMWYVP